MMEEEKEIIRDWDEDAPAGEPEEAVSEPGGEVSEEQAAEAGAEPGTALSPIKSFTASEGVEPRSHISLREILGGDILTASWLRRQMGLIFLCTFFAVIYITNRYSSEQEMIEIERLKVNLTEIRYRALTRSSELTVKTRQSQVERCLKDTKDSVLQIPKEPPFIIKQSGN